MEATFWGVRGSIPAPGAEFNRYGGNTPCIAVSTAAGELLILDAGTGVIVLGRSLMGGEFGRGQGRATLLLTHSHWDHIQGFPFFPPVYVPNNQLLIYGPAASPGMVEGILEGQMNPHFSPVQSLKNFGAQISFRAIKAGDAVHEGGARILAAAVPHGTISSLAYRLEADGRSLVYAPDAGYEADAVPDAALALFRGADCLVHDCTYTAADRRSRLSRGNASIDIAAAVAARCGVGRLVMFHYDQDYTDAQVDALRADCRQLLDEQPGGERVDLIAAEEGLTLVI